MANKVPRQHMGVGAWSNAWYRIEDDQTAAKVRAWQQDKLIARGEFVDLWLPVSSSTPGVIACTCVKNTTQSADRACVSCYSTKLIPGYVKFLTTTQHWSSAEYDDFTLSGTSILTTKKANILVLDTGATTGTITTQDKAYSNAAALPYSVKLEAYRRATGSTIALHFSTDSGSTWTAVSLTEVTGTPGASATGFTGSIPANLLEDDGVIRFRVTMTRVSANDLSPSFEIVRIRRLRREDINPEFKKSRRRDFVEGSILVLRPWVQKQDSLEPGRGLLEDHLAMRSWTVPLDFFDSSITKDTPSAKIDEALGGHAFYSFARGIELGTRYEFVKMYWNQRFGIFTHQEAEERRVQDSEPTWLVW